MVTLYLGVSKIQRLMTDMRAQRRHIACVTVPLRVFIIVTEKATRFEFVIDTVLTLSSSDPSCQKARQCWCHMADI